MYISKCITGKDGKRRSYSKRVPDSWNIKYYGEDMQEIINCVSCGRELQYGDTYCSNVYYTINGLWSYAECPECYEKNREKYLNRKRGKK